ncbi:septation protein SepH [Spirillospora sp. NPDC048824]|uniref:septation protein SepH n=1 Tax=Spirillospora sp. NPDC048824 TaxID=3364526 RepID=UPI003715BC85
MQELRLVAVSEDGTYLVLATAGRGTRFTLPVDDRLRAAVRGHFSRLGQFEIEVESPLRPKEIQARIRSGETAEEIAESAGIPVERVRWFEGPVLQEREYMAQQAQRVTVRRPGESTPGPPLGETVEERLGRGGVDLDEVEWDSWKCEDNTWRVRLSFFDSGRPHAAEWTFDPRRRNVSPLDEIAARLTAVEWDDDDDALSDTVTPLVPRRPAMKVVSSDRDPAARGLPAEPEQPGGPAPFRAAEPREYFAEHGRRAEPRPAFREAGETTPLREAARPEEPREAALGREAQGGRTAAPSRDPREERRPAEAVAAHEPAGGREPTRTREAPRPVETAQVSEAVEPRTTGRGEARMQETAHAHEADDSADMPRDGAAAPSHETGESREATGTPETSRHDATLQSEEPRETDGEAFQAGDTAETDRPGDVSSQERETPRPGDTSREHEPARPREAAQQRETSRPREAAQEREVDRRRAAAETGESVEAGVESRESDAGRDAVRTREAVQVREEEPTAPRTARHAETVEQESREEPPAGTGGDVEPQEPEVAARQREPEAPEAEPAENGKSAPEKKTPAQRQTSRTPPKKKPASRPTMPAAAAQDKPATGAPAAAASGEPAAQRPARRRKAKGKRASVPSWDEIMFGARRPE